MARTLHARNQLYLTASPRLRHIVAPHARCEDTLQQCAAQASCRMHTRSSSSHSELDLVPDQEQARHLRSWINSQKEVQGSNACVAKIRAYLHWIICILGGSSGLSMANFLLVIFPNEMIR